MKIEEVSEKCYILSGRRGFFHRFCDSGFRTKWTGLWCGSKKFLDYFAFRINDEWLSPKNCSEVYFDENSFTHVYLSDEVKIIEKLSMPEETKSLVCALKVKTNKQKLLKIFLEVGINIRDREENWHERKYNIKKHENIILVNSEKGTIAIGASKPFEILGQESYRDHFPGELERCFIPGTIYVEINVEPNSKEEIYFIFSCGENETDAVSNFISIRNCLSERNIKQMKTTTLALEFISDIEYLDELFKKSIFGLEKLKMETDVGCGYVAGFPWFIQFWGRDLGWMIPAIVDYGNFEDAKKSLLTLMKFQSSDGEIPNFISLDGKPCYGSIDATPLWIISLTYYVQNSGDIEFLKLAKKNIIKGLDWCIRNSSDGLLESEKRSTWMDTLDRDGKPIELQSIWFECLQSLKKLSDIFGEELISHSYVKKVGRKLEEFWDDSSNFYFDRIKWKFKDNRKTINSIFPVFFNVSKNPIKIIEMIESEEFTSPFGVRSLSNNDASFNPVGYHTGSVWSWITGLFACIEFEYGRPEKGLEYLKILKKMFDRNCIGSLDEAWNSENGDPILFKEKIYEPSGFFQGWGYASIIRCVDEFMLGIKIDAINNTIFASPSILNEMKIFRKRRIGNDFVKINMERKDNEVKINILSETGKNYRLVKVPKV